MRRLSYILISLFFAFGIALWASHNYLARWEPRLRSAIETRFAQATGLRLEISSLSLWYLHRIDLGHVRIWKTSVPPELVFQAERLSLKVSLPDIPRAILNKNFQDLLGLIHLEKPWIKASPDLFQHLPKSKSSSRLGPLFFSVTWDDGTLRWSDPAHKPVDLEIGQISGVFKIRGPRISLATKGKPQTAEAIRVEYSRLGKRWNARLAIKSADADSSMALALSWLSSGISTSAWKAEGRFSGDIQWGGRRSTPLNAQTWMTTLQEGVIDLERVRLDIPGTPLLEANGELAYDDRRITPETFTLQIGPELTEVSGAAWPFDTPARIETHLNGKTLQANLHAIFQKQRWVFSEKNEVRWAQGRLGWRGNLSKTDSDLRWTLENLSLTQVGNAFDFQGFTGRLNASGLWKGPLAKSHVSGSYWIDEGGWEGSGSDDLRGDFEITPDIFHTRATMADPRFRFNLQGTRRPEEVRIDMLELRVPSGGAWIGQATMRGRTKRINGTLKADQLQLPRDLPFLKRWFPDLKTVAEGQIRFSGSLSEPLVKGEFSTSAIQFREQTYKPLTLSWTFEDGRLTAPFDIPEFLTGKLQLKKEKDWTGDLDVITPWMKAELRGKKLEQAFEIDGTISSRQGKSVWHFPLKARGQWAVTKSARVTSSAVVIYGKPTDPVEALFEWDEKSLRWKNAHWGKRWSSQGRYVFANEGTLEASVNAAGVGVGEWISWTRPTFREKIGGVFDGELRVSGPAKKPDAVLKAQLANVSWRSTRFNGELNGRWTSDGLQPLTLDGQLADGGKFHFQGGYKTATKVLHGSLTLEACSLKPIGENFAFPKPLLGLFGGTLTVNGPPENLRFTGHLDGGPISYGIVGQNPFRMEKFAMDMTASPLPDKPEVWRLTFAEAKAQTAEEQIRFQNGSFMEFSPGGESRLNIRAEIRNLKVGLVRLFGGLHWEGTWQSREAGFLIQGTARTRSLFINDYELQEGILRVNYYDRILNFSPPEKGPTLINGSVDFRNLPQLHFTKFRIVGKQGEGLELDGDIGPSRWDFHMAGQRVDLGILGGMAAFPYPLSGSADVSIRGTGDLQNPNAEGTLKVKDGRAMGLGFVQGESRFIWRNNRLSFQKLELSYPGRYTLIGSGGFPLTTNKNMLNQDKSIDFTIRLKDSNLAILQSLMPEVRDARGDVDCILQITGTSSAPQLRGQVRIEEGRVQNLHYFRKLEDIQLDATFQGNELLLKELSGTSGGGQIRAEGRIGFVGFAPNHYDLQAKVTTPKGVEIQVPELAIPESPLAKRLRFLTSNSYASVHGNASFKGSALEPVFAGSATITNGHFTFPPSRRSGANPDVLEWFNRVRWDVVLRFQDDAWFENDYVAANLIGGLQLKGPNDRLRVDGGVDVTDGRINYLGIQFDIRQARMDIRSQVAESGLVSNTPYLRGIGESRVQTIDAQTRAIDSNDTITLTVDYAPLGEIKPRLTSLINPNLSQEKLLVRVGNLDVEKLTQQERNQLYQQQMVRVIDSSLATPLARKFLRPMGLNLRSERVLDPGASQRPSTPGNETVATANEEQQQQSGLNLLANSKYTLETNVGDRLAVGYGVRFMPTTTETLQNQLDLVNDLQMTYRLFRGFYVKGTYELPNANNPNYIPDRKTTIEKQWRFPWTGFSKKKKPDATPAAP